MFFKIGFKKLNREMIGPLVEKASCFVIVYGTLLVGNHCYCALLVGLGLGS